MPIDDLGLIERIAVQKTLFFGWPLFEQVLPPLPGTCQEIFRGGMHAASVPSFETEGTGCSVREPVRVRKGDEIYRVALYAARFPVVGTLLTRDHYQCRYRVDVVWRVSNPLQCVSLYHRDENPEREAMRFIKRTCEGRARGIDRNQFGAAQFPFEECARSLSDRYGLTAVCSPPAFYFDKTREDEISQAARLRRVAIEEEGGVKRVEDGIKRAQEQRQSQFVRDEKQKQQEFVREEKLKYRINEARITLLDQSVEELVNINKERLRDAADCNASFKSILEDSLRLLQAFHQTPLKETEIVDEARQTDPLLLDGGELDAFADPLDTFRACPGRLLRRLDAVELSL